MVGAPRAVCYLYCNDGYVQMAQEYPWCGSSLASLLLGASLQGLGERKAPGRTARWGSGPLGLVTALS